MADNISNLNVGDVLPASEWLTIDQKMIDDFAASTRDFQWIHVDREKCKKFSPFKTTIAHGLLSTALMPALFYEMIDIDASRQTLLNYGMDKVRYLEPVKVDSEIRYTCTLADKQQKNTGVLHRFDCEVAIKGSDKLAMVGSFLMLLVE